MTCLSAPEAADSSHGFPQGEGGLYYAGAWCGYGFHEDGLKAGMAAAVALGAKIPWSARATCPKISLTDSFFLGTFDRFARMAINLGSLRLILPNGEERLYGSEEALPPVPGKEMALPAEACRLQQHLLECLCAHHRRTSPVVCLHTGAIQGLQQPDVRGRQAGDLLKPQRHVPRQAECTASNHHYPGSGKVGVLAGTTL